MNAIRGDGLSTKHALARAVTNGNGYLGQHIHASQAGTIAASAIDSAGGQYGPLLRWKAVRDKNGTRECLAIDGKNFSAVKPPAIGWPGMVHARRRCQPVGLYRGALQLP